MNVIPIYSEGDEENIARIKCNKNVSNNKAYYKYLDNDVVAYPDYRYGYGVNKFDFEPYLIFHVDGSLSEIEIIDLIFINLRILSFLFMRDNILPDDNVFYVNDKEII